MRFGLLLLALFIGSQSVYAEDAAMRDSLHAFFEHGVQAGGAKAELIEVVRWPDAKGGLRWHLPHLAGHPAQVSLIAEKGRGANVRRWYVPVRLHWWVDALVARDDIPARTMLDSTMLEHAHVDIAGHATGHWWRNPQHLAGTRTTRPLNAGEVIYSSYIFRPPLLQRGDLVTLVARIGGIRVSTVGKVLAPAGRGDRVQVQNMKSSQVLQATIVDKNTAYVFVKGGAG